MKKLIALFLLGWVLGSVLVQAVWPLAVPNTFSTGQIIDATQINSNFSTIYTDYTAKFDPSTGHRHNGTGTDGTKVFATDLNSTGGKANQFLQADGSNASSWTGVESTLAGRLERQSATQLRYNVYNGRHLEINGEIRVVDGTVAGGQIDTTDNLITATGADAGAAMAASTSYYIYCSNASASPFPSDCRGSATASTTYRGGQYLGATGNAANWRLVGMAHTNSATQIVDSGATVGVLSYLNRLSKVATNNYTADKTTTSTSYVEIGATTDRVEFLAWNDEIVLVSASGTSKHDTASAGTWAAVGVDNATPQESEVLHTNDATNVSINRPFAVQAGVSASTGFHDARILGKVSSGTGTFRGDAGMGNVGRCSIRVIVRG